MPSARLVGIAACKDKAEPMRMAGLAGTVELEGKVGFVELHFEHTFKAANVDSCK